MKGVVFQLGGPESLSPSIVTAMEHPTKERHKAPDYEEHKKSQKTLKNMGDLKRAVKCPDKDHLDEWLAVHSKYLPTYQRTSLRNVPCVHL